MSERVKSRITSIEKIVHGEDDFSGYLFVWQNGATFPDGPLWSSDEAEEMLAKTERAKGTRTTGGDKHSGGTVMLPPEQPPTLSELGITKREEVQDEIRRVDTEIERTIKQLRAAGLSEREIKQTIEEAEEGRGWAGGDGEVAALTRRRGGRFRIDDC